MSGVEEKYAMHRKIKRENSLIKPKPIPVLPKICCSNGDVVVNTTSTIWIKIRLTSNKITLANFSEFLTFTNAINLGSKYMAVANSTINLGIINESELSKGVIATVTKKAANNQMK